MGATEGELRSRIDEKIKDYEKKMEVIYEREQSKEMMELQREKDREDRELTRDAFSDGDGTELWQFYED